MLDEMQRAFEQAQQQPDEAQHDLAQRILDWNASLLRRVKSLHKASHTT